MTPAQYLAHLADGAARTASAIRADRLDAAVAACPGWTLRDLVAHVGAVHRWASLVVSTTVRSPQPEVQAPPELERLARWFETGAADLLELLAATDPQQPCWTFAGELRAGFWLRRQALETAVHCWDAETAVTGRSRLDAALAADGIAEVIDVFTPRQVRIGRLAPLEQGLVLRSTDDLGAWTVGPDAVAEVAATAEVLLLLLWHRVPLDDPRVVVTGDRGAAAQVLQSALAP